MDATLVGAYYKQLTTGCAMDSDCECDDDECRTFASAEVSQSKAAAKAIVLAAHGVEHLCLFRMISMIPEMADTAVMVHRAGAPEADAFAELTAIVHSVFASLQPFAQVMDVLRKPRPKIIVLIAEVFRRLHTAHRTVAVALVSALGKLVKEMKAADPVPVPLVALLFLATDTLLDPNNYTSLVGPLCQLVFRVKKAQRPEIVALWKNVPVEMKKKMTYVFHQFITLEYYTIEVSSTAALYQILLAPVLCLDLLHRSHFGENPSSDVASTGSRTSSSFSSDSSKVKAGSGDARAIATLPSDDVTASKLPETITRENFYNDVLNIEVSLQHDLKRWLEKKSSLCDYPCVLTAASKARILQADAHVQMQSVAHRAILSHHRSPYLVLQVSRDNIVEDCLQQLAPKSEVDLKMQLKVKFKGEDGIDEGGLAKEFFQVIMNQLFDRKFAMFKYYQHDRVYWFNANTFEMPVKFELIGNLMGIALFNGVILNLHFPGALYKKLLGYPTTLRDLYDLDPEYAANLETMLTYDSERLEATDACFEYYYEYYGSMQSVDLKPGGSNISVTTQNVHEYVSLLTDHLLNKSVTKQFNALKRGFLRVTKGKTLKLFTPAELERAICGSKEYDFKQLERTTRYEDGFDRNSRVIRDFWSVLHEMPLEQQKKVLMFSTGSDRAPVEGLQGVQLVISKMGGDKKSLPTSHTCFNHLLLPEYPTRKDLEKALHLAINHATGFGLR